MKIKNHQKITNLTPKFYKYYFLGNIIVWENFYIKCILSFILMLQIHNQIYE